MCTYVHYIQIEFSFNQKDNRCCATSQQRVLCSIVDHREFTQTTYTTKENTHVVSVQSSVSTDFHYNNFQFFVSFSLAVTHINSRVSNTLGE